MRTLYVDLDGVLVNWIDSVVKIVNEYLSGKRVYPDLEHENAVKKALGIGYIVAENISKEHKFNDNEHSLDMYVYKILQNNYQWWSKLEWTPFGRTIWEICRSKAKEFGVEIAILTSPMTRLSNGNGSKIGKMLWAFENLGCNIKVILDGNKGKYAKGNNFLVDDTLRNTKWFRHSFHVAPDNNKITWISGLERKLNDWNNDR